jgi:CIC family chloride channel protein
MPDSAIAIPSLYPRTAVLELTANPNVILPAMLVIVVATLVTSVVFRQKSVFLSTLHTLGLEYPPNPVTLHLQRAAVSAIMDRNVVRLDSTCSEAEASAALERGPRWLAVEEAPGRISCVLNAADLDAYLQERRGRADEGAGGQPTAAAESVIHLQSIPAQRMDVADIDSRATIDEAQHALRAQAVEALCVRQTTAPLISRVLGVITQADIDSYREPKT